MSKGAWTLASLAPRGSKGLEGADAGARSLALARVQASVRAKYHGADSPSPTHRGKATWDLRASGPRWARWSSSEVSL